MYIGTMQLHIYMCTHVDKCRLGDDAVCNSPKHTCVLQVLLWRVMSVHGGVRQERVRLCSPPPQVTEHKDHSDQSYHIPESEKHSYTRHTAKNCNIRIFAKYLWLKIGHNMPLFKPPLLAVFVFYLHIKIKDKVKHK